MIATSKRPPKRLRVETVLLVESEVLIRMVLSDYLRQCGYRVIEAVSGEEALIVLKSEIPVRIVLSDVELSGSVDGFALSRWVRENRSDVRIILAGNPRRAAEAAGDLCDGGPMLSRPYEPQIVVDRIRRLLAEGTNKLKSHPADVLQPSMLGKPAASPGESG
jgi:DNA-binding response OmpR family regulator